VAGDPGVEARPDALHQARAEQGVKGGKHRHASQALYDGVKSAEKLAALVDEVHLAEGGFGADLREARHRLSVVDIDEREGVGGAEQLEEPASTRAEVALGVVENMDALAGHRCHSTTGEGSFREGSCVFKGFSVNRNGSNRCADASSCASGRKQ
jgi:hypothetical protein